MQILLVLFILFLLAFPLVLLILFFLFLSPFPLFYALVLLFCGGTLCARRSDNFIKFLKYGIART
ncbi:hypothetical protein HMPREF3226_00301 [Prevotella corporis]|uniref:Uncharacterized protein n=1 Tax=Prevotella corporis TaxID=28128 RepID=A0A133QLT1_9BACT|nr:hypothetical protein HMPREF3226_00301 [Prevotella corporis]